MAKGRVRNTESTFLWGFDDDDKAPPSSLYFIRCCGSMLIAAVVLTAAGWRHWRRWCNAHSVSDITLLAVFCTLFFSMHIYPSNVGNSQPPFGASAPGVRRHHILLATRRKMVSNSHRLLLMPMYHRGAINLVCLHVYVYYAVRA